MQKLFSVKGYMYEEKQQVVILDSTNVNKPKPPTYIRKINVIAKDLTFQQAKVIRSANRKFKAEIFPNVAAEQLKVVQLSEMV